MESVEGTTEYLPNKCLQILKSLSRSNLDFYRAILSHYYFSAWLDNRVETNNKQQQNNQNGQHAGTKSGNTEQCMCMCICNCVVDVYEITTLGGIRQPRHPVDSHRKGDGDQRSNVYYWGSREPQVVKLCQTQNSGLVDCTELTLPQSLQSFPKLFFKVLVLLQMTCRKCSVNEENPEDGDLLEKLPLTDQEFWQPLLSSQKKLRQVHLCWWTK